MNIQKMMKQAKAMQDKISTAQDEIANAEYHGEAGGSLVKVTISGKGSLKQLKIDPSLINADEGEILEDLIVAAFNNAKKEADEASDSAMNDAAGGLGLPAGFKMPF